MSEKIGQIKPSENGWHIFTPSGGGAGKYDKYMSLMCILVSDNKVRSAVYLTEKVMKELGEPKYIVVMVRGTSIGFVKSETHQDAYVVMRSRTSENGKDKQGHPFLNLSALLKKFNVKPGAYDAHLEPGGVVVFDTLSRRSEF